MLRLRGNYTLFRLFLDILLTELALFLATVLRPLMPFGQPLTAEQSQLPLVVFGLVALIWTVASLLLSVYAPRSQRGVDEAQSIFVAVTLTTIVLASVLYFSFRQVSRLQILMFYALNLVFLAVSRLAIWGILKGLGRPRHTRRTVLVLGAGEVGRDVMRMLKIHQWAGFEPIGFLDDEIAPGVEVEGYPVLGAIAEVGRFSESKGVDEIVVALSVDACAQFFQLVARLQQLTVRVRIVPNHIKTLFFRPVVEEFAGVPMISLGKFTLTAFERQVKRVFDLIVGTFMFVFVTPLLALVALAIRLDSPGPVIFKQQRMGEKGEMFWMFKFRSMVQDAEEHQEATLRFTEDGEMLFKRADDPRVTSVGRFLRRTSLDEFPQLLNVLRGEMSLVGPRPELPWIVERFYEPWQWQRFAVPQGITGWWQVNGRSDKPMHLHTEDDLFYIQNYSLLLDIQILWRTVGAVLRGRGAY